MHRKLALLVLALSVAPACATAQARPGPVPPEPSPAPAPGPTAATLRTITVSAEGEVSVRPDVAVVLAGVEATGKELAAVTADVNGQMRKVIAAAQAAGVAEKDVLTTRHDVQVNRPWRQDGTPGPVTGYTVAQEVRLKVRDVARLGAVLDRVLGAGANALRGLTFEKEDPLPERRAALAAAVTAARAKADAIAKAAGVQLGDVLSLSEGAPVAIPFANARMAMAKAEADGAPVAPGDIQVTATVHAVFLIR